MLGISKSIEERLWRVVERITAPLDKIGWHAPHAYARKKVITAKLLS